MHFEVKMQNVGILVNNGYRLWLVDKKRVVSGRNVMFDESYNSLSKEGFLEPSDEKGSLEQNKQQFESEESFFDFNQSEIIKSQRETVQENSEEVEVQPIIDMNEEITVLEKEGDSYS